MDLSRGFEMIWGSTDPSTGLYANNVYYIIIIQNLNNGGRGEADQDASMRGKIKMLNMCPNKHVLDVWCEGQDERQGEEGAKH